MFLNNKKMKQVYTLELMKIFIDALSNDNQSNYHGFENYKIMEAILNNEISFRIDENDTIFEINNLTKTPLFKNNKKNIEAIYAIKILLKDYGTEEL